MTTVGQALRRDGAGVVDRSAGRLGTRAALPRGRAVVGGLLVALSALGVLLAHQAAITQHRTSWLIARRPIEAGATIRAADLAEAPMDLYDGTKRRAFRSPAPLIGAVARIDIAAGDLLQTDDVGPRRSGSGPGRRLSIDLTPAQALDGSIQGGDRVDVVGSGDAAGSTSIIARQALVVSVRHPDGGLGSTDSVRITLVVADEVTAQSVVDTALHGKLTLVAGAGHGD